MERGIETCVIIPSYGPSFFLIRALLSVLSDVPESCEVLVVDDGIEEPVLSHLRDLKSKYKNLEILKSQGIGLVDALNTGLSRTASEIIFRMDSDDHWLAGRYNHQLLAMINNAALAICGGQVTYISSSSNSKTSRYPLSDHEIRLALSDGSTFAHPATSFRRNIVLAAGGYRKTFVTGRQSLVEDYDLWLRIAKIPGVKLMNLNVPVISYRQHHQQISNRFQKEQSLATFLTKISHTNLELINSTYGKFPIEISKIENRINELAPKLNLKQQLDYLQYIWQNNRLEKSKITRVKEFLFHADMKVRFYIKLHFVFRTLSIKLRSILLDTLKRDV